MKKYSKTRSDAPAPPKTHRDKGSPGMLGAASTSEVEHMVDPTVEPELQDATDLDPDEYSALLPSDIGGGG